MENEIATLQAEIRALATAKNAVILVHNYQISPIQEIADHLGDSLELARAVQTTNAETIIFCGVHFMAETAKILNPTKKVLLPNLRAGCFMADMITPEKLRAKKAEYPEAAVATYINSTAAVKAESDVIVTSSNAVKVVRSLPNRQIIFTPDQNLGAYVASQIPEKEFILWDGYCYVHSKILPEKIAEARAQHPGVPVVAHPECPPAVLALADHVCGTGGMLTFCRENPAQEFIIATETGMVERLTREIPGKKFWGVCVDCWNMKQIRLEDVRDALLYEQFEIPLPSTAEAAGAAIARMMEVQ